MYLYHIQSKDYVKSDCIEEFMTIAPNQKIALKRFREELQRNNECLGEPLQTYKPEWWDIDRYKLKDGLEFRRFDDGFIEEIYERVD